MPLYNGKGDIHECGSYMGISLLTVLGKAYSRVLIERVIECSPTEEAIRRKSVVLGRGMVVLTRILL